MKQWILPAGITDADGLEQRDVPAPDPGAGEVRIRVHAVSIDARDSLILAGPFGRLEGRELVPLSDVAGAIDAVGEGVTKWQVGDYVTNLHFTWDDGPAPADRGGLGLGAMDDDGVLAEYITLRADRVTRSPRNLSHLEASTLPVAGVTAWNATCARMPIGVGDTMVIIGSGGVSIFALQIATAVGARVVAMGRHDGQGDRLNSSGPRTSSSQQHDRRRLGRRGEEADRGRDQGRQHDRYESGERLPDGAGRRG